MAGVGYCAPQTIGTIRISNKKLPASDSRAAGLCVRFDNGVNIFFGEPTSLEAGALEARCKKNPQVSSYFRLIFRLTQ